MILIIMNWIPQRWIPLHLLSNVSCFNLLCVFYGLKKVFMCVTFPASHRHSRSTSALTSGDVLQTGDLHVTAPELSVSQKSHRTQTHQDKTHLNHLCVEMFRPRDGARDQRSLMYLSLSVCYWRFNKTLDVISWMWSGLCVLYCVLQFTCVCVILQSSHRIFIFRNWSLSFICIKYTFKSWSSNEYLYVWELSFLLYLFIVNVLFSFSLIQPFLPYFLLHI